MLYSFWKIDISYKYTIMDIPVCVDSALDFRCIWGSASIAAKYKEAVTEGIAAMK